MSGTLYLVTTPIGNLEDMSFRAIRILNEVDLIAAEDTRTSRPLLDHFEINTPTTSYHKFNERDKGAELVAGILGGKNVAVITDAGTPAISDPGEILVKLCIENNIPIVAVPGPTAFVTALTVSGMDTGRFVFEGFISRDKKERKKTISRIANDTGTIIIYESPHHIVRTLEELGRELGDRRIALCRELTKKFEEIVRTTISGALDYFQEREPRGEYVVLIEGRSAEEIERENSRQWEGLSAAEHVAYYESRGADHKEAMKMAAKDRGVSKRDIYNELLKL